MAQHFVAFASNDRTHAETITAAAKEASFGEVEYVPWTAKDASGAPLGRSVDSWLDAAEGVIADITFVSDNVTYEIGYAIGAGKSLRLIRNETISPDDLKAIGLLNTVLRDPFKTRPNLVALLQSKPAPRSPWHEQQKNKDQPLFILSPPKPTPFSTGLMSAVKKSMRIKFRSFNPRETARLTAEEAWELVASSFGVIVTWRDGSQLEDRRNNQRAALVFGMARGLDIPAILIAHTRATLPLDLVDQATKFTNETELPEIVRQFRDEVSDAINDYTEMPRLKLSLLDSINCGQAEAENEQDQLPQYFLETEEFRSTLDGKTNLVIGRKGSGKSAIFYQVRDRIRPNKKNIVLDLSPEGYQLIKLRELINKLTSTGVRKEFISAFWQYVLWLEIAYKILEKDAKPARRDSALLQRFERLDAAFRSRVDTGTGDFSERLRLLTDSIETRFAQHESAAASGTLMSSQISPNRLRL